MGRMRWVAPACGAEPEALGTWRPPLASPSPPGPPEITLAFAGDIHIVAEDGGVANRTRRLLSAADLAMLNLESAVTFSAHHTAASANSLGASSFGCEVTGLARQATTDLLECAADGDTEDALTAPQ